MEFLKQRWYWIAGALIALWIFVKIVGKSASGGANVTGPSGTQVVYGGTNANDAAVQVAQLQNQSALAAANIAASQAVQIATLSEHATESTNAANIDIAHTNATANVSIANIQASNALAITNSNNTAGVLISNNNTALGMVQSNNQAQVAIDAAAKNLEAIKNTNDAKLAAYGIQAAVVNNTTNAYRDIALGEQGVQTAAVKAASQSDAQRLSLQQQIAQMTYQLEASGQLNKGGEGGVNQVAVWNALLNPASAGTGVAAAAATAAASANQISSIIKSIGDAAKGTLTAVFA